MNNYLTRSHEDATIERFQEDPTLGVEFLAAILNDDDQDELQHAQRLVIKALPGIDYPNKP